MVTGFRFPEITAETLSGKKKTLPDAAKGAPALIVVAFVREAQDMIDSWVIPIKEEFKGREKIVIYEIPVIRSAIWRPMRIMIDGGMRSGIPEADHDYVMTVYGSASELTEPLEIADPTSAYLYLIDRNGIIRWEGRDFAETQTLFRLREMIHKCLRQGINTKEEGERNKTVPLP
ncbi:mitochondrial ATPase complex subunit ATP10 [Methanogenium marinum]|uniref:Mitochondrial ATPase complex subunit ATP10 n=1 Tax=Methanogenium marinum TaxID=348610 RepID=A0A9Q4PYI3_9EURY|nr:hypothetical protein [Methanogenium marinum]MDE4908758.1 mitochondrial ATPase complex subunit ATP10 [Methanogenium marinum]